MAQEVSPLLRCRPTLKTVRFAPDPRNLRLDRRLFCTTLVVHRRLNSIRIAAFMQKIDGPVVARGMSPSIVEWRTIG